MSKSLARAGIVLAILIGACICGAALCVMKGEGGGLLDVLGNLSAPYVIVAVLAGLTARRWWSGALLGIAATEATVAGFYGAWDVLLGHEVAPWAVSLWGGAGLVSGAVFGLAGRAAATRPWLCYLIPALLMLEPLVTRVSALVTSRFHIGTTDISAVDLVGYAIEIAVGVAVLLIVRVRVRSVRAL